MNLTFFERIGLLMMAARPPKRTFIDGKNQESIFITTRFMVAERTR
jgi:hypothetical protein